MCVTIGSNNSYVYNNSETKKTDETKNTENKSLEANQNKDTASETKVEQPKEKNQVQTLKQGSSEPVAKGLDFGIFDYKTENNRKAEKELKKIPEKEQMKAIVNSLSDPNFREQLKNFVESYGNVAEAMQRMAPQHFDFPIAINNEEGSIGAAFFEKLQQTLQKVK